MSFFGPGKELPLLQQMMVVGLMIPACSGGLVFGENPVGGFRENLASA